MTNDINDAKLDEACERWSAAGMALPAEAVRRAAAGEQPPPEVIAAGLAAVGKLAELPVSQSVKWATSLESALREHGQFYADGVGCRHVNYAAAALAKADAEGTEPDPDIVVLWDLAHWVYDTLLFDEVSVLIPWPRVLHQDEEYELHCADGPAVAWVDQAEYYWHGREIDARVIAHPDEVTLDYLRELSAEKRRSSYEALGHERVVRLLGKPAHSATIDGLEYALFRFADDAWLRMQSPPLQDGSQPYYIEPVHEDCQTCEEALAWRATGELGRVVRYEVET